MTDDDGPTVEDLEERIARLELTVRKLSEDFTDLRYEVNDLEETVDRRT